MNADLDHGADDAYDELADDQPLKYRRVSAWAAASVAFGVLSAVTALDWVLGLVPLVGVLFGLVALQRIDRNPAELTGVAVAKAGIALSAAFWVLGYGWQTYLALADAPPGYFRIRYESLQPLPGAEPDEPPPAARELEGKRVFVKGFMYPGRQTMGITQFYLCPTGHDCQFCIPDPKPTEVIEVKLIHGLKANYTTRIRGVGGEFHIRSKDDKEPGRLYQIKADLLQ